MSASDRQVGGEHYKPKKKNGVGHWDYCSIINVPYLESAATKYITRWRNKNGVQDLEKAAHYIEKRVDDFHQHHGVIKGANRQQGLFNRFIEDCEIPQTERQIIDLTMHWRNISQLMDALSQLRALIDAETGGATTGYVNQDR